MNEAESFESIPTSLTASLRKLPFPHFHQAYEMPYKIRCW